MYFCFVSACLITAASCMNGAYFDAGNCECVCSQANSGETCAGKKTDNSLMHKIGVRMSSV